MGRLFTIASVSPHSRSLCLSTQYGRLEEGEEERADSEVSSLIIMESRPYFRDPQNAETPNCLANRQQTFAGPKVRWQTGY